MALSMKDFEPIAADQAATISRGLDPERPFLVEGLTPIFATRTVRSTFIPMRDGTRLSTDFHIPVGASLPLPVILSRTPYNKRAASPPLTYIFPEQGFIYAVQDIRGRHESEGEFVACSAIERTDGHDTVSWLAAQPWCSGAVGAIGSSYVGETSAKLAAMKHPNHRCSVLMFDGAYSGGLNLNGAYLQSGVVMLRMLYEWFRNYVPKVSYGPPPHIDRETWYAAPYAQAYASQPIRQPEADMEAALRTLPVYAILDRTGAAPSDFADMMRRSNNAGDPYWMEQGFLTEADTFDTPTLHITGPQERGGSGPDNFRLFKSNSLSDRARDNQYLLFSPCPHSGYPYCSENYQWGARNFGDTRFPYYKTFVDWFGRWLRDDANGVEQWPKVRYFVAGANAWRADAHWPPVGAAPMRFYLRGDGALSRDPPAADEAPASFVYDPGDPTPSESPGATIDAIGNGYCDRSEFSRRPDVLTYVSEPFSEGLEIAGAVKVVLHVSSSAPDTDFAAVMTEIDTEGRAVNITHGIARARYREGLHKTVWMTPGHIYEMPVDLWFASIRIPAGHRIGLQIASSHFPAFDRNLNTGGDNYTETEWVVATNTLHHGPAHPSALILTVSPQRLDHLKRINAS